MISNKNSLFHWCKKLSIFSILFFVLVSCKTGNVEKESTEIKPTDGYAPASWTQLSTKGESLHSSFSPDGKALIFTKAMPEHKYPQAYKVDIASKFESRVTFQNAPIYFPRFLNNSETIMFNSSLDEWIENPPSLSKEKGKNETPLHKDFVFPDTEVYSLKLKGSVLNRMTSSPGFDGPISFEKNRRYALISSSNKSHHQIYRLDTRNRRKTRLTRGATHKLDVHHSPDKKTLAWTEQATFTPKDSEKLLSKIVVAPRGTLRPNKNFSLPEGHYLYPRWHTSGDWLLFSSNHETPKQYELYVVKKDSSCLQRITYRTSDELWGDFSSDGKYITFSSRKTGTFQVYIMDFKPRSTCPDTAAGVGS